jgi:hypothetical protein
VIVISEAVITETVTQDSILVVMVFAGNQDAVQSKNTCQPIS